jgi:cleavage stimulation factor subunit 3
MELENDNFAGAEHVFGASLLSVLSVQLWTVYLNYIRRRNDLTNDVSGTARTTVSQAYDFVLANIGIDSQAGRIWQEYIQFIRSAPGQIGGSSWQDQQKMDQLRKAYQRAIMVPMSTLNGIWKEYDQFEIGLNKITVNLRVQIQVRANESQGRKFLQEKSPGYMSARSANTALENLTRGIIRTTLPRLPPALGFDGDQEYLQQVELWKKWIKWEQEDPLVLKEEEPQIYKQRVLYVFKQAVMALRFWPEVWADAADWCFANGLEQEGDSFLNDGMSANPESCLITFKKADRLETTLSTNEADKGPAEHGEIIRAPYDKLLDTLYDMIKQLKTREAQDLAKLEESAALDASISAIISKAEDDEEEKEADIKAREAAKANQIKAIQQGYAMQAQLLSRTLSFAWIALMRAMRRVQGKGQPKDPLVGGMRKIFADARQRGRLTSDVYVAAALLEHHVYKEAAGTKIFERGAKLFPEDVNFTLEYLKHLVSIGDITSKLFPKTGPLRNTNSDADARVTFETVVSRLTPKPDMVSKAKPLYAFFHKYESEYGELSQISKLEKRMTEVYPEDPRLATFAARYSAEGFDPTAVRLIVSPSKQMRPKSTGPTIMQSIEQPSSIQNSPRPHYVQEASPRPQYLQATNSPKRPFQIEDSDDLNRPRKLARGESPLKGAAGRRLDQQKRLQQGTPTWQSNAPPFVVPRDITFLLSIIPRADLYTSTKFSPEALVRLLRETIVPDFSTWKTARDQSQPPVQRYDGTRSTHIPPPPRPDAYPQQQQSGGQNSQYGDQGSSWQNDGSQPPYPDPHASYPGAAHQRDAFSRLPAVHGLPPRPAFPPPLPVPSRSGYHVVADPGQEYRATPPQLLPAHLWYSQ